MSALKRITGFKRITGISFIILSFMMVNACSQYQRLLQSDDFELKYEKAIEYYEDEEYGRAITLLSDVMPAYRGTAEAERINYYFAKAHFHNREYMLASHYFKSFVDAYPNSEHAEEFLFLSAYCQYLESPRYSLDQTSTRQAIRELQNFINRHPQSDRVSDANELIDELRYKLERKHFEIGKMYYNISAYQAAAKYMETYIKDYPDSEYREEAMFLTVKAYFEFAYNSVEERQEERFEDTVDAFYAFKSRYPESEKMDEARRMYAHATDVIDRFQERRELTDIN